MRAERNASKVVAGYFLDTSALAKLYHFEAGSTFMSNIVSSGKVPCYISRLALVEMQSVFAVKSRMGALSVTERLLAIRQFRVDLARDLVVVGPPLSESHYREAATLVQSYGVSHGLRSLDALQLAVALELQREGRIFVIVSSDHRLCAVANACGCASLDPAAQS